MLVIFYKINLYLVKIYIPGFKYNVIYYILVINNRICLKIKGYIIYGLEMCHLKYLVKRTWNY